MPITLASIPAHLQVAAAEKMETKEFMDFSQSSNRANVISSRIRKKKVVYSNRRFDYSRMDEDKVLKWKTSAFKEEFVYRRRAGIHRGREQRLRKNTFSIEKLSKLSIRISAKYISFMPLLDNATCANLINSLKSTETTARCLELQDVDCDQSTFASLLQTVRPKKLWFIRIENLFPAQLCLLPEMHQLTDLKIDSNIEDKHLLLLKAPRLRLMETKTTSAGFNRFFKEWLAGDREIKDLSIEITRNHPHFSTHEVMDGIPHTKVFYAQLKEFIVERESQKIRILITDDFIRVTPELPR